MNQSELAALTKEISDLKDRHEYAECIHRLNQYESETIDPAVRTILLIGKATCAMQLGDLAAAQAAALGIDPNALDPEARNYARLVAGSVALRVGQFNKADSSYSEILADKAANEGESSDILCEATAGKAFAQARLHHYADALSLMDLASKLHPEKDLQNDIGIYRALCLQGQGRLDEAEQAVRDVLADSSGVSDADAWFRLGGILYQRGNYRAAIDSFQHALAQARKTGVSRPTILKALKEAEIELAAVTVDEEGSQTPPRVQ